MERQIWELACYILGQYKHIFLVQTKYGVASENNLLTLLIWKLRKGGVFTQPCRWMGAEELWMGTVSDSQYQTNTSIFVMQDKFSRNNLVNGEILHFKKYLIKDISCPLLPGDKGKKQCVSWYLLQVILNLHLRRLWSQHLEKSVKIFNLLINRQLTKTILML